MNKKIVNLVVIFVYVEGDHLIIYYDFSSFKDHFANGKFKVHNIAIASGLPNDTPIPRFFCGKF